ncbi:MAG: hypothetical protein WC575_03765 [Patescibacteria group bacterium]
MNNDFGKIIKKLLARGERIVILSDSKPMVLLPLDEYEQLTGNNGRSYEPVVEEGALGGQLESIDPPAGPLPDDDQYFPEPL